MLHKIKSLITLCVLLANVSACGFEPLYVERKSDEKWYYKGEFDTSISEELADYFEKYFDALYGSNKEKEE